MKLVFLFQLVFKSILPASRLLKAAACLVRAVLMICFPDLPEHPSDRHADKPDKVSDSPVHIQFSSTSSHAPGLGRLLLLKARGSISLLYLLTSSIQQNTLFLKVCFLTILPRTPYFWMSRNNKVFFLYSFCYAERCRPQSSLLKKTEPYYNYLINLFIQQVVKLARFIPLTSTNVGLFQGLMLVEKNHTK